MKFKLAKINDKYPIMLPRHRAEWYKDRQWEVKRLDSMHKNIGKGDVVYYVGAEVGDHAALCQMWGAEMYLFEPNHTAWRYIKEIWEANNLKRAVGLFAMFVGNETDLEPSNPDKALYNGEGWKLQEDNYPMYAQGDAVMEHGFSNLSQEKGGLPVVTIDDVASQIDLNAGTGTKVPTAIVMDIEGAEFEALQGAENTINTFHPKIWLSLHPDFLKEQYDTDAETVKDWLKERGYKETLLDKLHEEHYLYEWEK